MAKKVTEKDIRRCLAHVAYEYPKDPKQTQVPKPCDDIIQKMYVADGYESKDEYQTFRRLICKVYNISELAAPYDYGVTKNRYTFTNPLQRARRTLLQSAIIDKVLKSISRKSQIAQDRILNDVPLFEKSVINSIKREYPEARFVTAGVLTLHAEDKPPLGCINSVPAGQFLQININVTKTMSNEARSTSKPIDFRDPGGLIDIEDDPDFEVKIR